MDFIDILHGSHAVGAQKAPISENSKFPECFDKAIQFDFVLAPRTCRRLGTGSVHIHAVLQLRRGRVDILSRLNLPRAIVDLVCDVCALRTNIPHLSHNIHTSDVGAIDLMCRVGMSLRCIDELLDGDRAEGLVIYLLG